MTITAAMVKKLKNMTGAALVDCKKALQTYDGDLEKAARYLREKGLAKAAKQAGRETKAGLVVVKASGDSACAIQIHSETDFVAHTDDFRTLAQRLADQVLADAHLTDAEKLLAADFVDAPGKHVAQVVQELVGKLGENITVQQVAHYRPEGASVVCGYIHAGALEGYYGPMEGRLGALVELGVNDATADTSAFKSLAQDLALQVAAAHPTFLSPDDIPNNVLQQELDSLRARLDIGNKPEHIQAQIIQGQLDKFYQETCLLRQVFVKDDSMSVEQWLQRKSQEMKASLTVKRFAHFEVGA